MVVTGMGIQGGSSAQRGVRGGEMSGASRPQPQGAPRPGPSCKGRASGEAQDASLKRTRAGRRRLTGNWERGPVCCQETLAEERPQGRLLAGAPHCPRPELPGGPLPVAKA